MLILHTYLETGMSLLSSRESRKKITQKQVCNPILKFYKNVENLLKIMQTDIFLGTRFTILKIVCVHPVHLKKRLGDFLSRIIW